MTQYLEFEKPLAEIEGKAEELRALARANEEMDIADEAAALDAKALTGKRIGVMRFSVGSQPDINATFSKALDALTAAGAVLVEIDDFERPETYGADSLAVLEYEFKDGLNTYLADAATTVTTRSLADVIAFNNLNSVETAIFDQSLFDESEAKGPLTDLDYETARTNIQRATRENGIDKLLADNQVDMLVSPSGPLSSLIDPINGDVWPSWSGAGYLAAVAGYPHISVPMGDVHGIPLGLSIMGAKGDDASIIAYGYAFEQAGGKRVEPQYLRNAEDRPEIEAAMRR